MDLVAEGKLISVHRSSITTFQGDSVILKNGTKLPSNAVVFATGWKPNQSPMFPSGLLPELGLQYPLTEETPDHAQHWEALEQSSKQKVKEAFPRLAQPPILVQEYDAAHFRSQSNTPCRLFRNIAPPSLCVRGQRDVVVLGTLLNTAVPTYAEISSLWAVAYLENLPFSTSTTRTLSNLEEMEENISLINAWGWVRYRDQSLDYLDGSVEIQDFMDLLVRDLGLEAMRKKEAQRKKGQLFGIRGWFREWYVLCLHLNRCR